MNLAGALGGIAAGIIVATSSYAALCFAAAVPVLALLVVVGALTRREHSRG
jgi:predicted MFS family arabinose efflux permease